MIETHFPSFTKCQSDSLSSKSSAFTKHQFPLIISLFILHLMMQPGLENSYDLYCSSRMTDSRTMDFSLPSFTFCIIHDFHPSTSRGSEQCPPISSPPSLSHSHAQLFEFSTQHHQFSVNKLIFLFFPHPSMVTLVSAECAVGTSPWGGQ